MNQKTVVVAIGLLIGFACVYFVVIEPKRHRKEEASRQAQAMEKIEQELADAKEQQARNLAGQKAADELGQKTTEQLTRTIAAQSTSAALEKFRTRVPSLEILIRERRAGIVEYDDSCMKLFAENYLNPSNSTSEAVNDYWSNRARIIKEAGVDFENAIEKARLLAVQDLVPNIPDDLRREFDTNLSKLVEAVRTQAAQPLPDPLIKFKAEALARDKARERYEQLRVQRSKAASEAFIEYCEIVRQQDGKHDDELKFHWSRAVLLVREIYDYYALGKLDKSVAQELLQQIDNAWIGFRLINAMEIALDVGGDVIPEHNPKAPTILEAFEQFRTLSSFDEVRKKKIEWERRHKR